jgi:hypothetical protein
MGGSHRAAPILQGAQGSRDGAQTLQLSLWTDDDPGKINMASIGNGTRETCPPISTAQSNKRKMGKKWEVPQPKRVSLPGCPVGLTLACTSASADTPSRTQAADTA